MTGTVAEMRTYLPDKPQADLVQATQVDGSARFTLPYFPVVAGSYQVRVAGTLQTETTHYTIDTATGVITFVTAPDIGDEVSVSYQHTMLSDADLQVFLDHHDGALKLAAADALEAIGSDQVLVLKVVRMMDTQTDGAAVSRELRLRAKALRESYWDEESEGSIDVIEMVTNQFAYRDRITKNVLRGQL